MVVTVMMVGNNTLIDVPVIFSTIDDTAIGNSSEFKFLVKLCKILLCLTKFPIYFSRGRLCWGGGAGVDLWTLPIRAHDSNIHDGRPGIGEHRVIQSQTLYTASWSRESELHSISGHCDHTGQ